MGLHGSYVNHIVSGTRIAKTSAACGNARSTLRATPIAKSTCPSNAASLDAVRTPDHLQWSWVMETEGKGWMAMAAERKTRMRRATGWHGPGGLGIIATTERHSPNRTFGLAGDYKAERALLQRARPFLALKSTRCAGAAAQRASWQRAIPKASATVARDSHFPPNSLLSDYTQRRRQLYLADLTRLYHDTPGFARA